MSEDYDPHDISEPKGNGKTPEQLEKELEMSDLVWLMKSKIGRRIVWRLLEKSGVFRLSYTVGDATHTAFLEGNRNFGQRLMALLIGNDAALFTTMLTEHSENVRRNADA